jgi:hypothetical protein
VPFNSFAEYAHEPNPKTKKKDIVWFAINDDRPLICFAGTWTEFKADRGTKSKPIPGPHRIYGFSHDVAERRRRPDSSESHAGLLTDEERDVWIRALWDEDQGAPAAIARRCDQDRRAGGGKEDKAAACNTPRPPIESRAPDPRDRERR